MVIHLAALLKWNEPFQKKEHRFKKTKRRTAPDNERNHDYV